MGCGVKGALCYASKRNAGGISAIDLDGSDPGYDPVQGSLFEKGELKDWGNLPQYYMVRYVDTETGEPLDKPVVTVFTVDHGSETGAEGVYGD